MQISTMKSKLLLFYLFCIVAIFGQQTQQQKIDSLKTVLLLDQGSEDTRLELATAYQSTQIDSALLVFKDVAKNTAFQEESITHIKSLIGIGDTYLKLSKLDSADYYFNRAAALIPSKNNYDLYTTLLLNQGKLYFYQSDYESAKNAFQEVLDFALAENNVNDISSCYNNIALCLQYSGEFEKALEMHLESAKIAEQENDQIGLAKSYNNMGLIYNSLRELDKAEEYLLKSIEIKKKLGETTSVVGGYINIGTSLRRIGANDKDSEAIEKSRYYFNEALKLAEETNYVAGENMVYVNLALLETTVENFDLGVFYGKRAIEKSLENNSRYNEMVSRVNLGDTYQFKKEFALAEQQLLAGLAIAKELNNRHVEKETMMLLSRVYTQIPNYKKAYEYQKSYSELNDSIASANVKNRINELETIYETEKKEKEIILQQEELLKQELKIKNKNLFAFVLASALILLGFVIYMVYKKKQQLSKELQLKDALALAQTQNRLQEQRLRISRDLHDNIGSQLTFIISSIDNLKFLTKTADKNLKDKLSNINQFANNTIAQLRDTIWAMNKNEIPYDEFHVRVLSLIEKAKLANNKLNFKFESNVKNSIVFDAVSGIQLFRVLQEALNNSLKYAEAKNVTFNFKQEKNKLTLSVSDDGIGFDISKVDLGHGLENMQKRMEEIGGTCNIKSSETLGTHITVTYKYAR